MPNAKKTSKVLTSDSDSDFDYAPPSIHKQKVQKTRSSGRVVREPQRLVQERVEGLPKYTEKQRAKKLRETLAKSAKLTENLLRRMDKDSDEEDGFLGDGDNMKKRKRKGKENVEDLKILTEKKINHNIKQVNDRRGRKFEGDPIPEEQPFLVTNCIMKPYQIDGLRWIINLWKLGANGILGDEMGLGKTLQTIALFCHLYEVEKEPGPFLVLAPLSTIANWQNEVNRFAPSVPCHLLYPPEKAWKMFDLVDQRIACPELGGKELGPIFITSYETATSSKKQVLQDIQWSYIVLDEGHRIKNRKCRLAHELKKLDSTNRLLLTGTPMQNNLGELWALLHFLQPDVFDDCEIFENYFNAKTLHEDAAEKARLVAQEDKSSILAKIHRTIAPFLLRRVKAEVDLSIPPKKEVVVYCPLTETQANQYSNIKASLIRAKKNAAKDGAGLGHYQMQYMVDLRSAVNHPYILNNPGTTDHMVECCGKLQVLDQMLERLRNNGHKTLVFSQMTRLLDIIGDYLYMKNIPYCSLDGRMDFLDRQSNIERFTKNPDVGVFLLSTRAGGLGINLTAADTCIIYDSDWNPQQDLQAQARCHRIGQTKPVMVYRLVTKNTIDQVMVERAQAKRALERLVVHKDKFKSGAENLKTTAQGLKRGEIMDLLLSEGGLASCTAVNKQRGLDLDQLDKLMDRTNMLSGGVPYTNN